MRVTIKALDRSREWPRLYEIRLDGEDVALLLIAVNGQCKIIQRRVLLPRGVER